MKIYVSIQLRETLLLVPCGLSPFPPFFCLFWGIPCSLFSRLSPELVISAARPLISKTRVPCTFQRASFLTLCNSADDNVSFSAPPLPLLCRLVGLSGSQTVPCHVAASAQISEAVHLRDGRRVEGGVQGGGPCPCVGRSVSRFMLPGKGSAPWACHRGLSLSVSGTRPGAEQ